MFKTILVPLDGSSLSEQALPLAVSIAKRADAKLRLVHIRRPSMPVFDRDMPAAPAPPAKERDYLNHVAWRIGQFTKLEVQTAVLDGPIAETLAEHARGVHADLMVLTTHGRGPLSRFWMGSVADELVRRGPAPLLVQRPTEESPPPLDCDLQPEHLLIALDGSKLAEAVLEPAIGLAKTLKADVTLFQVVVTTTGFGPAYRCLIAAGQSDPSLLRALFERIIEPNIEDFRARTALAQQRGEMRADADWQTLRDLLYGVVEYRLVHAMPLEPAYIDGVLEIVFQGVR